MKISIGKAAKKLGVSIETLRRWDKSKFLIAEKMPSGHRRYSEEQIINFTKEKMVMQINDIFSTPFIGICKVVEIKNSYVQLKCIRPIIDQRLRNLLLEPIYLNDFNGWLKMDYQKIIETEIHNFRFNDDLYRYAKKIYKHFIKENKYCSNEDYKAYSNYYLMENIIKYFNDEFCLDKKELYLDERIKKVVDNTINIIINELFDK